VILALRSPDLDSDVRIDSALAEGTKVWTEYDPMLAKVIVRGGDRSQAISRLVEALRSTEILGVTTNVGFLRRLLDDEDVRSGDIDTGLIERRAPTLVAGPAGEEIVVVAGLLEAQPHGTAPDDPWRPDGWRFGGAAPIESRWSVGDGTVRVASARGNQVTIDNGRPLAASLTLGEHHATVTIDGVTRAWAWARSDDQLWLGRDGDAWRLILERETIDHAGASRRADGGVTSPMPGTVLAVYVSKGDAVDTGSPLVTVEAMKMEYVVRAPTPGVVTDVLVSAGDSVQLDQSLATIAAERSDPVPAVVEP
jgi:acetyl-CoA/propionyl-CoA carboxylase biotin carboxyl carrier protein